MAKVDQLSLNLLRFGKTHLFKTYSCSHKIFFFRLTYKRTEIADAFVKSAVVANHPEVNYNSGDQIGVSYLHQSTKNGWRQTAAKSYLSDIKNRKNLTISIKSWATKLLFDTNATLVKGVKFVRNKREYTVKARREVILSAGAFESPKLLMLSGIGPEDDLKKLKIDVIKVISANVSLFDLFN